MPKHTSAEYQVLVAAIATAAIVFAERRCLWQTRCLLEVRVMEEKDEKKFELWGSCFLNCCERHFRSPHFQTLRPNSRRSCLVMVRIGLWLDGPTEC